MTVVDFGSETHEHLQTTVCGLCGGRLDEDYHQFWRHLLNEHTFDDLNLSTTGGPPAIERSPGGVAA